MALDETSLKDRVIKVMPKRTNIYGISTSERGSRGGRGGRGGGGGEFSRGSIMMMPGRGGRGRSGFR